MVQHNRIPKSITFVALALVLLAPLPAEAGGVEVFPFLYDLCKVVNCAAYQYGPHIDSIFSGSNITPGGFVVVVGKNFGFTPGGVYLSGLKTYYGQDFGQVELTVDPADWHDTVVGATIPYKYAWSELTGLKDQPATLGVGTPQGGSNKYPVNFKATPDYKLLPMSDVKTVSCGDAADNTSCNGVGYTTTSDPFWPVCKPPNATLCGYHDNDWCCTGTVSGYDGYKATLKNGWVFDTWNFVPHKSGDPEIQVYIAGDKLSPGGTNWDTQYIAWKTNNDDWVSYEAYAYIKGPKGVPWK